MTRPTATRRRILTALVGIVTAPLATRPALAAALTPGAAEGPFYPTPPMRHADTDNDLVRIAGAVRDAGGEIIALKGRVTDKDGTPLPDHRIEIWQCDTNGKYMHEGDRNPGTHDTGFQGFGHDITDADGRYVFRTIKPAKYPGRTPHIHVKVLAPDGSEILTTQFYEAGHPDNTKDGLYRRMSEAEATSVSMIYTDGPNGSETTVDVVV